MNTRSSIRRHGDSKRLAKRSRSTSPEGLSPSDAWEMRKKPAPSPAPSSASSLSMGFPSPWDLTNFGSASSSPALSLSSIPSVSHSSSIPSASRSSSIPSASPSPSVSDLTHSLRLPLPISHTIRLPESLVVLPGAKDAPSVTVSVPLWVHDYAQSLVADIGHWKQLYDLTDLPSLLSTAEDLVFAHSDERAKDLTADELIKDFHAPLDSCLSTLHDAFIISENFGSRLTTLAEAMPSFYFTYHLRSLSIIQQEQLAIRWALRNIIAPLAHWLGRPSALLNELSKVIITPARKDYSVGILSKKTVDTLIPGNWVDDNIINYFSGNEKGSHHIILGETEEVLFCSPLFWPIMRQARNLKLVGLNGQIFCRESISKIQRILMPINVDESHWILSYVNVKDGKIQILDSFITPTSTPSNSKKQRVWVPPKRPSRDYAEEVELTKRWVSFLVDCYSLGSQNGQREPQVIKWLVEAPMAQAPVQGNGHDCGLYVVMFVRHLTSGFTINHGGLAKEMLIGKTWISLTTARLRLWMELPKTSNDWENVPDFLRLFPKYRPYTRMILPGLPGA